MHFRLWKENYFYLNKMFWEMGASVLNRQVYIQIYKKPLTNPTARLLGEKFRRGKVGNRHVFEVKISACSTVLKLVLEPLVVDYPATILTVRVVQSGDGIPIVAVAATMGL